MDRTMWSVVTHLFMPSCIELLKFCISSVDVWLSSKEFVIVEQVREQEIWVNARKKRESL